MNDIKLNIQLVKSTETFKELETEWKLFENKITYLTIFSSYNFLYNYWLSFKNFTHPKFGIKRDLRIILIYQNNNLEAILPLCLITKKRKKIFKLKYLELLGQQFFTSNLDVIANKWGEEIHTFVIDWINNNINFDILNFELISEDGKLYKLFKNDQKFFYNISPEIKNDSTFTYNYFKSNIMSSNFRGILNNSLNKLNKNQINLKTTWKDFDETDLPIVNYLSSSKLKDGKYNIYDYEEMKDFVIKIYKLFNAKIGFIVFNDKVTSYQVYIFHRDECMWFDLSYDREVSNYRPGILQYSLALENLLTTSIKTNILGYGFDQNKMGICNTYKKLYNIIIPGNKLFSKYFYNEKVSAAKDVQKIAFEKTLKYEK